MTMTVRLRQKAKGERSAHAVKKIYVPKHKTTSIMNFSFGRTRSRKIFNLYFLLSIKHRLLSFDFRILLPAKLFMSNFTCKCLLCTMAVLSSCLSTVNDDGDVEQRRRRKREREREKNYFA